MSLFSKYDGKMRNYRAFDALNYSRIKKLDTPNPKNFFQKVKYSKAISIGDIADVLITTPDEFDNKFIVVKEESVPTAKRKIVADYLSSFLSRACIFTEDALNIMFDSIEKGSWYGEDPVREAFEAAEYSKGEPIEKVKEIAKEHLGYILSNVEGNPLKYITEDALVNARKLKMAIKTSPFWKNTVKEGQKGIEILYQLPVIAHINGRELADDFEEKFGRPVEEMVYERFNYVKGLLDLVVIDHTNKTIQPIDLKMTEYTNSFNVAVVKNRYDIQAALYTDLLQSYFEDTLCSEGYEIRPFYFLSAHPDTLAVIPWRMSNLDLEVGRKGGKSGRRVYKGYQNLFLDLMFYVSLDNFDYPVDYHINGKEMLTSAYEEIYTD